jgi:diguanylate cyclase (GGDEF)-like protein
LTIAAKSVPFISQLPNISRHFPPSLEEVYQADMAGEKLRIFYIACGLSSLLYLGFAPLDVVTLSSDLKGAWMVRAAVILATGAAALFAHLRRDAFLRHYPAVICLVYLGWGAGVEALLMLSQPTDLAWSSYYAGLMLVSMALYIWSYLRPLHAGLAGLAVVASYVVAGLCYQRMGERGHWVPLVQNVCFLAGTNVVGAFALTTRERFARQAFLLKDALVRDVRLKEEAKRRSEHLAGHDALTGLPNRVSFVRRLGELIATRAPDDTVGVLFLDLDGFKPVNDQHGHAAGDHVLAVVAQRLRTAIRPEDVAARIGGDEFVVALPLAGQEDAAIVERTRAALCRSIAEPIDYRGCSLRVTASIGMAIRCRDGGSAEELLHRADQSMYASKRGGKRQAAACLA